MYDPKDGYPKQCMVWGKTIRFDAQTLNDFLGTPVIIPEGEKLTIYSQYLHTYPDHEAIVAKLCTLGGKFMPNADGAPWKILRSVLSCFNLAPTFHTSDLNMDGARLIYGLAMKMEMDVGSMIYMQISQSSTSRLNFPVLITTLCDAQGADSDTLAYEPLSSMINLTYIKKNCWNLAYSSITFPGPRRVRARATQDTPPPVIPPPIASSSIGPSSSSYQQD